MPKSRRCRYNGVFAESCRVASRTRDRVLLLTPSRHRRPLCASPTLAHSALEIPHCFSKQNYFPLTFFNRAVNGKISSFTLGTARNLCFHPTTYPLELVVRPWCPLCSFPAFDDHVEDGARPVYSSEDAKPHSTSTQRSSTGSRSQLPTTSSKVRLLLFILSTLYTVSPYGYYLHCDYVHPREALNAQC